MAEGMQRMVKGFPIIIDEKTGKNAVVSRDLNTRTFSRAVTICLKPCRVAGRERNDVPGPVFCTREGEALQKMMVKPGSKMAAVLSYPVG